MYPRVKYHSESEKDWTQIKNPVGSKKWDGASFFMEVQPDGSLKYFSRKRSVKGHYPERSAQLPWLTQTKLPQYAGHTYVVELVHTGNSKHNLETHGKLSGILNSLKDKAINTQQETGPVRAVLHGVINPTFNTYQDTLQHLKEVEGAYGHPDVMFAVEPHYGVPSIMSLVNKTRHQGAEGVIVTSATEPETTNTRIKVKHFQTHNLKISKILQEYDIHGKPKQSMGAVSCVDRSGREVCDVGSGFSREDRIDAWENPQKWIGRLIQVKDMGLGSVGGRLRHPVYNGEADSPEPDLIS
jgi:hypothetical protein